MEELGILDVSNNFIAGSVPSWLGKLSHSWDIFTCLITTYHDAFLSNLLTVLSWCCWIYPLTTCMALFPQKLIEEG
jgi:hypothetical protein